MVASLSVDDVVLEGALMGTGSDLLISEYYMVVHVAFMPGIGRAE